MKGIFFDELHSYEDFGLILTEKSIGTPDIKKSTVDVIGADGELDYTEYFGEVKYENRKLTFDFSTKIVNQSEFIPLYSQVQNALHGKRVKITLDEEPDYYYLGRVTINQWKSDSRIGKITIEVDSEPYKYKKSKTIVSSVLTTETIMDCANLQKNVVPTITASSEVTITYGTYTITFSGTKTDSNIVLKKGHNFITVTPTSNAEVTFEYQERGL